MTVKEVGKDGRVHAPASEVVDMLGTLLEPQ